MSEKSEKKGFWSTLFAPKKKTPCCCGGSVEVAPVCDVAPADTGKKEIKVLGTGCSTCKALYNTVQTAVGQMGIDATVEKVEDLEKIMEYNIMSLPALVVNGKVVAKGQKLSVEQVKELLK